MTNGNRLDKTDEIKMFEYQRLQERITRDSEASYTLMTALVALSEAIFAGAILNFGNLDWISLTGAAIASLSSLGFWYFIDRRFVWGENRRLVRMMMIENDLHIFNQRLFNKDTIDNPEIEDAIEEEDRKSGVFSKISVHYLYLIFFVVMVIAWLFLILSKHI